MSHGVVIFDPRERLIIEVPAGSPQDPDLDNAISVQDIYSSWKEWVKDVESPYSVNSKWPQAMRTTGGDPTNPDAGEFLGETYFLLNEWRIRPAEGSHRLTLNGNLFTDPAGFSPVDETLGAFTVVVEYARSNLVELRTVAVQNSVQTEIDIILAAVAGNADVSGDDLTITIYDNASPQQVLRTLSVSADGRVRRIL